MPCCGGGPESPLYWTSPQQPSTFVKATPTGATVLMCVSPTAQGIFNTLDRAGQLVEQTIEQLYSEAAGKFLADRFVTGTCPKCHYEVPLQCS